jgi:hypothetical protein
MTIVMEALKMITFFSSAHDFRPSLGSKESAYNEYRQG